MKCLESAPGPALSAGRHVLLRQYVTLSVEDFRVAKTMVGEPRLPDLKEGRQEGSSTKHLGINCNTLALEQQNQSKVRNPHSIPFNMAINLPT